MPAPTPVAALPRRWSWRRRLLAALAAGALAWGGGIALGMNPSVPSDAVMNLWPVAAVDPRLAASGEGRALVVLQHGLWRSAWALWRFERALRAHGYEVLNVSYPSTRAHIEDHAARLAAAIRDRLRDMPGPAPAVYFVGHSMGGLVIRAYLARPDAVPAAACVFVATPHRGAVRAAQRQADFLFRWIMGDKAARQLVPGSPFFAALPPRAPVATGTIIGGKGDDVGYSDALPGDDDGTVTVAEAHLDGEADSVLLPLGHTRIGMADATIRCVLCFLRDRRFGG